MLPILHKLLEDNCGASYGSPQKPEAVIVAPTRELAIQIKDEGRKFSRGSIVKCVVAYGGTSVNYQSNEIAKGSSTSSHLMSCSKLSLRPLLGCNVLIATVGRLMDFVEKGKISFENVRFLVLDEADRMLDMGCEYLFASNDEFIPTLPLRSRP